MTPEWQLFIVQGLLGWVLGITLCYWFLALIIYSEVAGRIDSGRYWIIALIIFVALAFAFLTFEALTIIGQK